MATTLRSSFPFPTVIVADSSTAPFRVSVSSPYSLGGSRFIKDSHHGVPHASGQPPRGFSMTSGILLHDFGGFSLNVWAPCASGWQPQESPAMFRSPHLLPNIWVLTGASSVSWLARQLLGCALPACKPCTGSASRPKKEPRDKDRDMSDLMDGESSLSTSWRDTIPRSADSRQGVAAVFPTGRSSFRGNRSQVYSSVIKESSK